MNVNTNAESSKPAAIPRDERSYVELLAYALSGESTLEHAVECALMKASMEVCVVRHAIDSEIGVDDGAPIGCINSALYGLERRLEVLAVVAERVRRGAL